MPVWTRGISAPSVVMSGIPSLPRSCITRWLLRHSTQTVIGRQTIAYVHEPVEVWLVSLWGRMTRPQRCAGDPVAVVAQGMAKAAIDADLGQPLATGLDLEAELFVGVFGTEDAKAGVESFLARGPGKANFRGR